MASFGAEAKCFLQDRVDKKIAIGTAAATSTVLLLAYIYNKMSRKRLANIPERYPINLDNQSHVKESGERGSHFSRKGKETRYIHEDAKTLYGAFQRGLRTSDNGNCLGTRSGPNNEFVWMTYQEVNDRARTFGSALVSRGLKPGDPSSFLGIYSANRPEWVMFDQACCMFSMITVPLYDTLGSEACTFIINQTKLSTIVCDRTQKVQTLLDHAADTPTLKLIIVLEPLTNNNLETAQKRRIEVISLTQLEDDGRKQLQDPVPPRPSNVATICYTSGTTGNPKGVVLTHENIISVISAVFEHSGLILTTEDYYLSYLPLAHMFERLVQTGLFMNGCRIGFYRGDIKLLLEDVGALRPTIFATVPRLLNRIYDKVHQGVASSAIKSKLFKMAFNRKKAMLEQGVVTQSTIWDMLVFGKIQKLLGGRVRTVITGSAPLSVEVLDFIRICFGCTVMEGYGQTECSGAATLTIPYDTQSGHVGAPLTCNRIKLVDVPEMDYYTTDNKGEICVKGANVMVGYYKDPEKTAETIKDGWLYSGDIGEWLPNGALKIIDRKKHIFKLAQGEYLAPEKIENIYVRCPLVAQCFVDGDSIETFPVAIVVPDPEVLPGWAAKHNIPHTSMERMCQDKTIKRAIFDELQNIGKESGLKGFEQVKNIYLYAEQFSMENGLLTPTFKAKRPTLRKKFESQIKDLYREIKKSG